MKNFLSILLLILLMNINISEIKCQCHFDVSNHDNEIKNILDNNLDGCNYLIVTPNNQGIRQWADTLARFRNEQGILTKVVSINEIGDNLPFQIKKYFNDIYKNWDLSPSAILLFGDYSLDKTKGIATFYLDDNTESDLPYLTDNKLVDFNDDNLPEIVIARMPVANAEQAELMVNKTIRYERFPSTNPDYYSRPVTAMGFEEARWFQLCSEVIAGYFEKIGKEPNRLNAVFSGKPDSIWSSAESTNKIINHFGPKGLNYIPSDLRHLTNWDADQDDLSEAINNGTFIVQHRDHGQYQAWTNPYFSNNEINKLNNEDLTFIMSSNCRTGNFNFGSGVNDCFAERFMRVKNGAVAVVAASETSYSFVNDIYVWGVYDYLWNDFMPDYGNNDINFKYPAFANAYGKYFLEQSSWHHLSYNKKVTYNLFHYFGDAFLQLNTEMPKEINISYPKEILTDCSSFTIEKDEDTRVAFSHEGRIIATSFGGDSIINIKPFQCETKVKVVATKQNHYRHESYINVRSHLSDDEIKVYPNPTKEVLFVESRGVERIEIYNNLGQMLMDINNYDKSERIEINCDMLKKGLFHLHIIYEDKRVVKSFIVM